MTERPSTNEAAPLPPIEQLKWRGEYWHAVSVQAASEKHPKENQDVIRVNPELGLFVLCDGMGGHDDGRMAASVVSEAVDEYFSALNWDLDDREMEDVLPNSMIKALRHAQARLLDARDAQPSKEDTEEKHKPMDTTATALLIRKLSGGQVVAIVGHVGNCRAYSVQVGGEVKQLTDDQDIMATEHGAKALLGNLPLGELDRRRSQVRREMAEAPHEDAMSGSASILYKFRNITMSIGSANMAVAVDVYRFPEGGRIALMTDGVYENLGSRRTEGLLSVSMPLPMEASARDMVVEAQANGRKGKKALPTAHPDDMTLLSVQCT